MKPLVRPTVRCLATAMAGLFAVSAAASPQAPPFRNPDLPADERLTNLLSLMTPDEKLQALGGFGSGVPRLGVPGFGASEGIHGLVQRGMPERGVPPITTTQFPQPPGMGSTWNPDLVRRAGGVQGAEARYITQSGKSRFPMLMVWGPQADLARDPRWGRAEEVYGEDPFFNGVMATAFARGIQGNDPKYWQAAPLLKHFLANSNENGRMSSNSQFDERLFWEYYSVPFRMAFQDAGANAVMASYNAWNGTPMHLHPVLRDVLIGQWGVAGHLERRRRRPEPLGGPQGRPRPEGRRGRRAEGGNQPVPGPGPRGAARRTEGRPGDGGGPRRGAAAEVPRLAQARAARPAGDRPVRQASRRPGAVGQPGAPRHLEDAWRSSRSCC